MDSHEAWQRDSLIFVVSTPDGWSVTPVPGEEPVALGVDELIRATFLVAGPATRAKALPPGTAVQPVWAWVGRVESGQVTVEGLDGSAAHLDADDLRVLDAIGRGPTTVDEVTGRSGVADAAARLGRLTGLALVRTVEEDGAEAAVDAGPGPDATGTRDDGDSDPGDVDPAPAGDEGRPTLLASALRRLRRDSVSTGSPSTGAPAAPAADPRIPVYSVWHRDVGPALSLGMLTSAARADETVGAHFDIRRPEDADSLLADLGRRSGPAVLLCSDYVWSVAANLDIARRALALNSDLVVVHGGPSCPAYPHDAAAFLAEHGEVAHVLCRGEGEHVIVELLTALAPALPRLDPGRLVEIEGLTFRHPESGEVIRTPDRGRIVDLGALPSPYLTGEFDHIEPEAWRYAMAVETTRGCPYGCTFCDWGSSTLSRIRKFPLERVAAELEWAATRGVDSVNIADANFGILARDVETTVRLAAIRTRTGFPQWVSFTPAKNTTKHLLQIMDVLRRADIVPVMSLSLQTIDTGILDAVRRSNISTDHYLTLAADYRRNGHPLQSDLLLGVPEQTYETYRRDLQFNFDHEIQVRTWPVQLLPNSPMNDPEYRRAHGIRADEHGIVMATATFDEEDRAAMFRLRRAYVTFEVFGLMRHVLRWMQWDRGIDATQVIDHMLRVAKETPHRFPSLTWILGYFDIHPTSPAGWSAFYREVKALLIEDLGVPEGSELETVLALNQFLMPTIGRVFPASISLPNDYLAYYRDAVHTLYTTGLAGEPSGRLGDHPSAEFTIEADPIGLCTAGLSLAGDSREDLIQGDFYMASTSCFELLSPLTRLLPFMARSLAPHTIRTLVDETIGPSRPDPAAFLDLSTIAEDEDDALAVPVVLRHP